LRDKERNKKARFSVAANEDDPAKGIDNAIR